MRARVLQFLVKHLFNTIKEEDILRVRGRDVLFEGRALSPDTVSKLKQDAQIYKDSFLWKILMNECKYQANLLMYEKSLTIQDIMFAKALLYEIDVLEKKLEYLANM